ncbi:GGDEF domain-containing protein [Methylobacterium currus]|uniref:GGDEF domain-containing protein n=1 Tax=Methylobacterium currus TaxID=2051553 RepID=UPI001E51B37F|nr:GGDEF domain-containing protein [Methylobacterium currus]UHC15949.1 GGDEF domain-containing protein [Methylobacterium currus]
MTLTVDDTAMRQREPDLTGRLDRLLRFDDFVEARHEAEHGRDRVAGLLRLIPVGMIIYNVYNLTSFSLTPDIAGLSIMIRLLIVTPMALVIAGLIAHVGPTAREALVLAGMMVGVAGPILFFWLTQAPLGNYTFAESILVVIYGNVLIAMRFRHALAFSIVAFACAVLAVYTKAGLDPTLREVFCLQFATACAFSLYANFRMEELRCREYLRTLAAQLASEAAEEARRLYQGLSGTDALTGLPNRRVLDETAEAWFAEERPAALMMIDVDHFKPFNDTLGHPAGDACLRRVAAVLATFVQGPGTLPDILAARFGGEEFAFIVRDVGAPEAVRLGAALVRAVEALGIGHPGRPDGHGVVTVSVGIALKGAGAACDREALFASADTALYRAKRLGRNGYALAEDRTGTAPPWVAAISTSA